MARGTTKAKVHPVFKDRLAELQDNAGALSKDILAEEQRIWQIPEKMGPTRLTQVPRLHVPAWEREVISENYVDCMSGVDDKAGTVGDVISLKQQMDYNAAEERAFRLRHATITRCIVLQHGRRDGHYQTNVFPFVVKQANDAIAQGAQAPMSTDASGGPGTPS